eukprot:IDg3233t1
MHYRSLGSACKAELVSTDGLQVDIYSKLWVELCSRSYCNVFDLRYPESRHETGRISSSLKKRFEGGLPANKARSESFAYWLRSKGGLMSIKSVLPAP